MAQFPIKEFEQLRTPFYYYDLNLLQKTLEEINKYSTKENYHVQNSITQQMACPFT